MGTIFKYREKLFQCRDLKKKLKKLKLDENDIEIIRDNIKEDDLEKAFCEINSNGQRKEDVVGRTVELYYFFNGVYTIVSTRPDLSYLPGSHDDFKFVKCIKCKC